MTLDSAGIKNFLVQVLLLTFMLYFYTFNSQTVDPDVLAAEARAGPRRRAEGAADGAQGGRAGRAAGQARRRAPAHAEDPPTPRAAGRVGAQRDGQSYR